MGVLAVAGVSTYLLIPNRHQAIIKTTLLHQAGLLKSDWQTQQSSQTITLQSPTFWVDGLYKSMEGPKSHKPVQIANNDELVWLNGFTIKAIDPKTEQELSNEFICHMNIDLIDKSYYTRFNMPNRIHQFSPRVVSLSHGQEQFSLPKGYGFPLYSNEIVYMTTQTLNHNYPKISQQVVHEIQLEYAKEPTIKPLMNRTVYIQLPYEWAENEKSPLETQTDLCLPVEKRNHVYLDQYGNKLSGHWRIPTGKSTYSSEVSSMLNLQDSLRLHAAAVHVHPFATSLTLYDQTTKTPIFTSRIENYTDKIGLKKIEAFSSEEGVWLHPDHRYELLLEVDNTSAVEQDMMGSMFLFFYDQEMDEQLRLTNLK